MELLKWDKAKQAIAEAKEIDEIKGIRDQAQALVAYARQQRESLEVQNNVAEIKIRCERRMGEMLKEMEKNNGQLFRGSVMEPREDLPTLSEIGISKAQSHRFQTIADFPEEKFESHIQSVKKRKNELTSSGIYQEARREKTKNTTIIENILPDIYVELINKEFQETNLESESVDFIITDPPYPKEFIPLYSDLAQFAAKVLKPGGSLLAMSGQFYLPELCNRLFEHLSYHWTIAYLTSGGQSPQIFPKKINTFWKPVLWFTKGEYTRKWIGDVAKSQDNDKRFHNWGQSESGMFDLMKRFVEPGDVVLDPFLGGGTSGIVSLELGCNFIGIEKDRDVFLVAKNRLGQGSRGRNAPTLDLFKESREAI